LRVESLFTNSYLTNDYLTNDCRAKNYDGCK